MRHDPERAAAAHLGGELEPRQRERFEAHMLGCDDCWREVTTGRQGRMLAEGLREVAPQHLRERVRATIAAAPTRPRRRIRLGTGMPALLGVIAVLVAAGMVAGGLLAVRERAPAQPAPITAAVAGYREGLAAWDSSAESPPARQLGGLTWQGARQGELAGLPVVAHTYQDPAGHRLVLLLASQPFPRRWAHDTARRVPPGPPGWTGRCCLAPTTPRPRCCWAPTGPRCWPRRSGSGCAEAVRSPCSRSATAGDFQGRSGADEEGRFTLCPIPGRSRLVAWASRVGRADRQAEVQAAGLAVQLELG